MVVALCRYAGLRRGEALRLTWADVDLDRKRLTVSNESRVRTTKRRARVVPICAELAAMLGASKSKTSPDLHVASGISASRSSYEAIQAVWKRAGLTAKQPTHCLRKSRETQWIEEGHDPYAVAKWLGHSPIVAQQHYHKPTEAAMDRATVAPQAPASKQRTRTAHR